MRVLHFVHSLDASTGGPSRTVPRLARAQATLGHQVGMGVIEHDVAKFSAEATELLGSGVSVTFFESAGKMTDAFGVSVRAADVVNVHGLWNPANHVAMTAAVRARVPLVVSPRGMLEPWALQNRALKKKIAWWAYQRRDLQRAAALHATSEQERANLLELGLTVPVTVVPNGVDTPPSSARGDALPPRSILFLSRIDPKKGIPLLIDAAAELAAAMRNAGWRIFVVGPADPSYLTGLQKLTIARGVADLFEFRPAVDGVQKWSLLRSAELLVLPTFSENFGLVVAEALASGTPVLTTTGTPWSELHTFKCGWWVQPESGAVAGALRDALGLTAAERRVMGSRGAELVGKRYDWRQVAEAMVELYRRAIDNP